MIDQLISERKKKEAAADGALDSHERTLRKSRTLASVFVLVSQLVTLSRISRRRSRRSCHVYLTVVGRLEHCSVLLRCIRGLSWGTLAWFFHIPITGLLATDNFYTSFGSQNPVFSLSLSLSPPGKKPLTIYSIQISHSCKTLDYRYPNGFEKGLKKVCIPSNFNLSWLAPKYTIIWSVVSNFIFNSLFSGFGETGKLYEKRDLIVRNPTQYF